MIRVAVQSSKSSFSQNKNMLKLYLQVAIGIDETQTTILFQLVAPTMIVTNSYCIDVLPWKFASSLLASSWKYQFLGILLFPLSADQAKKIIKN